VLFVSIWLPVSVCTVRTNPRHRSPKNDVPRASHHEDLSTISTTRVPAPSSAPGHGSGSPGNHLRSSTMSWQSARIGSATSAHVDMRDEISWVGVLSLSRGPGFTTIGQFDCFMPPTQDFGSSGSSGRVHSDVWSRMRLTNSAILRFQAAGASIVHAFGN